jgi:hypothetical protein
MELGSSVQERYLFRKLAKRRISNLPATHEAAGLTNQSHGFRIQVIVRVMLRRCVIPVLLMAMLGGHITELFDRWDQTLRTGKDIDYSVVFVAACLGVAFITIKKLALVFRRLLGAGNLPISLQLFPILQRSIAETPATGPSPPLPTPIRI